MPILFKTRCAILSQKRLYIDMYFIEILLYFIPFGFVSALHLYYCVMLKKRPADSYKLTLMPSLFIPVCYAWYASVLTTMTAAILISILTAAWAGDYYLIKPVSKKKFFYGLITFFLSHTGYASLFIPMSSVRLLPLPLNIGCAFLYSILTALIYLFIGRPKGLRGAAAVTYTVMLFLLQYLCFSPLLVHIFVQETSVTSSQTMLIYGILLFTLSDIILAYSLFKREFKYSRFFVMTTYITAQFFLVYGIILYNYNS